MTRAPARYVHARAAHVVELRTRRSATSPPLTGSWMTAWPVSWGRRSCASFGDPKDLSQPTLALLHPLTAHMQTMPLA